MRIGYNWGGSDGTVYISPASLIDKDLVLPAGGKIFGFKSSDDPEEPQLNSIHVLGTMSVNALLSTTDLTIGDGGVIEVLYGHPVTIAGQLWDNDIRSDSSMVKVPGTLKIATGGVMFIQAATIRVGELVVLTEGRLTAYSMGYHVKRAPIGVGIQIDDNGEENTGGGSHGGYGNMAGPDSDPVSLSQTYGSVAHPTQMGAGPGNDVNQKRPKFPSWTTSLGLRVSGLPPKWEYRNWGYHDKNHMTQGWSGGGAIRIIANQSVSVAAGATIDADGGAGGGAGGSLLVETPVLHLNGQIRALGGLKHGQFVCSSNGRCTDTQLDSQFRNGNFGGGGRVAVHSGKITGLDALTTRISARRGGMGHSEAEPPAEFWSGPSGFDLLALADTENDGTVYVNAISVDDVLMAQQGGFQGSYLGGPRLHVVLTQSLGLASGTPFFCRFGQQSVPVVVTESAVTTFSGVSLVQSQGHCESPAVNVAQVVDVGVSAGSADADDNFSPEIAWTSLEWHYTGMAGCSALSGSSSVPGSCSDPSLMLGNGVCNSECDTLACGFDHRDCTPLQRALTVSHTGDDDAVTSHSDYFLTPAKAITVACRGFYMCATIELIDAANVHVYTSSMSLTNKHVNIQGKAPAHGPAAALSGAVLTFSNVAGNMSRVDLIGGTHALLVLGSSLTLSDMRIAAGAHVEIENSGPMLIRTLLVGASLEVRVSGSALASECERCVRTFGLTKCPLCARPVNVRSAHVIDSRLMHDGGGSPGTNQTLLSSVQMGMSSTPGLLLVNVSVVTGNGQHDGPVMSAHGTVAHAANSMEPAARVKVVRGFGPGAVAGIILKGWTFAGSTIVDANVTRTPLVLFRHCIFALGSASPLSSLLFRSGAGAVGVATIQVEQCTLTDGGDGADPTSKAVLLAGSVERLHVEPNEFSILRLNASAVSSECGNPALSVESAVSSSHLATRIVCRYCELRQNIASVKVEGVGASLAMTDSSIKNSGGGSCSTVRVSENAMFRAVRTTFSSCSRMSEGRHAGVGGAAHIDTGSRALFEDSVFRNNVVIGSGGAVSVTGGSVTNFTRVAFVSNRAAASAATTEYANHSPNGGEAHISGYGSRAVFDECNLGGNRARVGSGGAVSIEAQATVILFRANVFNDNICYST